MEEVRKCHLHTCAHSGCGSPRWPWWHSDRGDGRSHKHWGTLKALLYSTAANCTPGERPPSRPLITPQIHNSEVVWRTAEFLSLYGITLMHQLSKSVNHLPIAFPLFFLTLNASQCVLSLVLTFMPLTLMLPPNFSDILMSPKPSDHSKLNLFFILLKRLTKSLVDVG